jgi:hypothetical protein
VGRGPDLGFGGFGGGLQWVGDPIWVLGVSAVGHGGWGTRSGFWGLRRRGYQVGVDGLMITVCCRGLAMVAERGRR